MKPERKKNTVFRGPVSLRMRIGAPFTFHQGSIQKALSETSKYLQEHLRKKQTMTCIFDM